ncbi:sugar phosphate isomerase/epimerase [Brevibacillus sp. NRS-1366]|uniref:sugar phosphate isomerase/epimerase n=1 Tax=Brevibacillus sp. NRS-1366 TaxID=3233899 RepID=UPI003D1A9EF1
MNNFMIGQYGTFDEQKYARDFRKSFYGIEACLFEEESDVLKLRHESLCNGFQVGIHFPLRAGGSELRDALFLAQDNHVRQQAFDYIQRELEYMSSIKMKPAYILFHYPKPVILDNRVNWESWRFTSAKEYVFESEYCFAEFTQKSEALFDWLSAKGKEYGFTPVLEFDALNAYIYKTDFLEKLLEKYPLIKLCLDTGRMHVQEKIDPHFLAFQVIKKFAKYAQTIHLWNMKCTDKFEYNHYPALPECRAEDGWAPIEQYLKQIMEENPDIKIMFEHRSDMISDEQLERCYTWIDQLVNNRS